ncbi:hypothetical protein [Pseudomonas sp. MH9.3]|uniref:hypothetical protein n=1 Tax=Pseudomonas sp. MH9.3 TaxID=3048630 RepID=UPI002AC95391|nr:hypothetical protein [Pseudomonas sp. MH9.3]MEB0108272.1 hypothetical protein [Pseudomonas sp. MH9.3]WPX80471.1 hypothetical protein RHM60_04985 [Pseudomonas sp. MH9.3]WQG57595.1 hypothetical protein RHM66_21840 [Pseudomonas sp. RTB3]
MERFLKSIEKSLDDSNWYSALYMSLTLPDVCSSLETADGKTDGKKFARWFDRYMKETYSMKMHGQTTVFMAGDDCYVLRCSLLHQGLTDVGHQRAKGVLDRFYFTTMNMHRIRIGNVLHLNVKIFCEEMVASVRLWVEDFNKNYPDKVGRLSQLIHIHSTSYSIGGVNFLKGD